MVLKRFLTLLIFILVMMSDSILVTGAAGFIGFSVAKALLDDGMSVVGVDNMCDYYDVNLKAARLDILQRYDGFSFSKIDISHTDDFRSFWYEAGAFKKVIHLAAQAGVRYSLTHPHSYTQNNTHAHLNIIDLCRHTAGFEHLVYASSSSVYGSNAKLPFSVDDPVDHPVSLYAATKRSCELMSDSYAHLYGLPQTGLRFFTVYGPWGRPDMAPYIFTKAVMDGETFPVFNNGEMKRDFTYIDDIVDGVLSALNHRPSGDRPHRIFNLGNSYSERLMDFIGVIEKAAGKKACIDFQDMQKGDVEQTYADITKTNEILGYQPKTKIEDGVPMFVQWYKEYYNVT